jgi:phosphoribosylglycinamide formyltransferase-1
MKSIVIFASGTGTNADNIMRFFENHRIGRIVAVFSNKAEAGVVEKAKSHHVPVEIFTKVELEEGRVAILLQKYRPDLIVLAGFLLKLPAHLIQQFPDKIINIHPALLPHYGGHGMYGMNVHHAVLANKEKQTGISVHYVNEHYDDGAIICQKSVDIQDCSNAEEIAGRVHTLEHRFFPEIIESVITSGE